MDRSTGRTFCLIAPMLALLVAGCSSGPEAAEGEDEVAMQPGQYQITLTNNKLGEAFGARLAKDRTVCINNPPRYVATAILRLNMVEAIRECGQPGFERTGNRLQAEAGCHISSGSGPSGRLAMTFDGVVSEEQLVGTMGVKADPDAGTLSAQEKVLLAALTRIKAEMTATHVGPC
ncbi:MAG: hypothetical protein R3D89_08655 [Sphingomonadaceae bacterium]|jgi:hypothetical protein